jgi:hypothetical protein
MVADSVWAGIGHTEEAAARNLNYVMSPIPQPQGYLGFGCAFSDLDIDGDQDVVIVGAEDGLIGIFENDGTGNFINRSAASGLANLTQASAIAIADYNSDGLPDIYLSQVGEPNVLARNNGGFSFINVAAAAGVDDPGSGKGASWGDLDGDGRVDLYVCNYNGIIPGTEEMDNKLYRNLGNGSFEDISVAQGVDNQGYGYQSVWFDHDLDGDVDLYLSNDRAELPPMERNQLWDNDNGTLVNISVGSGADVAIDSMGLGCGDFDGNGFLDLYCTNIPGLGGMNNPLLLNQGNGTFIENGIVAGVDNGISGTSWGAIFYDMDNSGTLDLYVNNQFTPNTFYLNPGSFPCIESAGLYGIQGNSGRSFSSAVGDVDNDGDLDLLVNNLSGNVELFINHTGEERSYIRYRMVGIGDNTQAIGGRTETRANSKSQLREIRAGGNSYLGQNELIMHVGLDAVASVEVDAFWPGGTVTRTISNLPANQTWTLYAPERLGDVDGGGSVRSDDFVTLAACIDQPFVPGCEIMDFDGDSDVDADDYAAFLAAHTGVPVDCNLNGVIDYDEILADPGLDANGNGLLDVCVAVPAVGEWGMAILVLVVMGAGCVIYGRYADERRLTQIG